MIKIIARIGRFWLESVCSASKLIPKCSQMNYEMNCITMHRCTDMYCNVLQTARVHWQVPVLLLGPAQAGAES